MSMHLIPVHRPLYASLGPRRAYAVVAIAWDDETNLTRYLLTAPDRPVWVPEHDLVQSFVEDADAQRDADREHVAP
jgi:hypothetical protein